MDPDTVGILPARLLRGSLGRIIPRRPALGPNIWDLAIASGQDLEGIDQARMIVALLLPDLLQLDNAFGHLD